MSALPNPRALSDEARAGLAGRLGHDFASPALLELAITHRSFANEAGMPSHNERLEFLGDAVLGLLVSESLFLRHPERTEGELARAKSALVSAGALAPYAEAVEIGDLLRLGVGESRSGGGRKASLLADGFEALLGAVFLDGGLEAARRVVERYLAWAEAAVDVERSDAKTELQERVQARGWELPSYRVVEERGPEHEKWFTCEVLLRGEAAGRGLGRTKKEAERRAAAEALAALEVGGGEPGNADAGDAPGTPGDG